MAEAPAGWYPDPLARSEHRYWDGRRWTQHAMRAGRVVADPLPGGITTVDDGPEDDAGSAPGRSVPAADPRSTVADAPGVTLTDPVPAPGAAAPDRADDPPPRTTSTWPPRLPGQVTERVRPAPDRTRAASGGGQPLPTVSRTRAGEARLSATAVLSLVLALLWLGGLGSLVAIVLGALALRRIGRSAGTRRGRGAALVGVVLGMLGVLATVAVVLLVRTGDLAPPPVVPERWIGGPGAAAADR